MKIAVAQVTSCDDPNKNLRLVLDLMNQAQGADMIFFPEVINCVSLDRRHQMDVLECGVDNSFVAAVRARAQRLGIWVSLGSVAVKTSDADGRFANRSYVISDTGQVVGIYDKIHMFDVTLSATEQYQESKWYRPGEKAVLVDTPWCPIGLSICYDLRFPHLYRTLAQVGARILTVPSAFAVATGQAHWHSLLRARAIENGCYVIAAAQTGTHAESNRNTFGHSLVVDPWGEIV
ncbi:MAG: carbon-nitrogen hydrolase family protein, partial [Planktomarina sp.]